MQTDVQTIETKLGLNKPSITLMDEAVYVDYDSIFFLHEFANKRRGERLYIGFRRGSRKAQQFDITGETPEAVIEFVRMYTKERGGKF